MSNTLRSLAPWASVALMLMALTACGEDAEDDSGGDKGVGQSCGATPECQSGLLCVGSLCQDPNATSNPEPNPDPGPMPNPDVDPGPTMEPTPNPDPTPDPDPMPNPDPEPTPNPEPEPVERPDELTGGVSVFEFNVTANVFLTIRRGNIGAAFVEPTPEAAPVDTIGDCDIVNVVTDTTEPFGYSAGAISVAVDNEDYTLTPTQSGGSFSYGAPLPDDSESVFGGGATISVSAAGGPHVGAFSGTITAPDDHALQSPAADASVGGNEDLTLSWSGSGSGQDVVVTLSPMDDFFGPVNGLGLSCTPSGGDSGQLVIPAAAMARLQGPKLAIVVIKASTDLFDVDGDEIAINATYAAGNIVNLQ